MQSFYYLTCAISLLILLSGLIQKKLKKFFLTDPIIGLILGIVMGPKFLNIIEINFNKEGGSIMLTASSLTLSMALMSTALKIPNGYLKVYNKTQVIMILLGMPLMVLSALVIIYFLFHFSIAESALIAAVISPTDPVLAASIISGEAAKKIIPDKIRYSLSFESGANDGLAFPFVILPLLFLTHEDNILKEYLLKVIVWENIAGMMLGAMIGFIAAKILIKAEKAEFLRSQSLLSFSILIALFVLSFLRIIHSNNIIGVFVCGLVLDYQLRNKDFLHEDIQKMMEKLFTIPAFVLLGILLPWDSWNSIGWKAIPFVVLVLLFKRIPAYLLLSFFLKKFPWKMDIFVLGWFGPIGISAIFYACYLQDKYNGENIWPMTTILVASSTIIHGISSFPLSKLYAKWNARKTKSKNSTS